MPKFPLFAHGMDSLGKSAYAEVLFSVPQEHRKYPLSIGDSYRPPVVSCEDVPQDTPGLHAYSAPHGEPQLLDAIVTKLQGQTRRHGVFGAIPIQQSQVQVLAGASAGIAITFASLFNAGEEIIIPSPYWPLAKVSMTIRGLVPLEVPLFMDEEATPASVTVALDAVVTPRTTGLYLNSPNNPTGRCLTDDVIEGLVAYAVKHDMWIIVDEAYEDLWYGDEPPRPIWTYPGVYERCVVVHSLSKSYALAGARVGYAHGTQRVIDVVRSVSTFTTFCASKHNQLLGAAAMAHPDSSTWLSTARHDYAVAAKHCVDVLQSYGVQVKHEHVQGSTFLFFDVAQWMLPSEDTIVPFLIRVARETGVLLLPGVSCGKDFPTHVRLCFTTIPLNRIQEAMVALSKIFVPKES